MVPVRKIIIAVLLLLSAYAKSQTIYYPAGSSQLLKSTAEDVAMLLQRAVSGSKFTTDTYTVPPATGIVLIYDPSVNFNNQACRVKSNGSSFLSFAASQDNGLCFGIYEYLNTAGFRFYQPGTIWENIPALNSAYKITDTTYNCRYKYKSWFISGGTRPWIMDNNNSYSWDNYNGENGHAWALYQRRNNMTGGYRFRGHRADIMTGSYLETLKKNVCFVAPYNGSRAANTQSVPDVNSVEGMQLWSNAITKSYTDTKTSIYGDTLRYANNFRNFNYNYETIGIEVPDGAQWANSVDDAGCPSKPLIKASDQQFTLSNFTATSINSIYPVKKFNLYAYGSHADVPSSGIGVNKNIEVQVIAGVYQNETSAKGLLNRWYAETPAVSEYQYLNLDQWSGGTPYMYLNDLQTTLKRLKEKNSQGIVWESSPSKFSTLPYLFAANRQLLSDIDADKTLQEFCNDLFGKSASTIYELLKMWSDTKTVTIANGARNNKYKLPLYFKTLNEAVIQSKQDLPVVQHRLNELEAYLHYMKLYYSWSFDQVSDKEKINQAAALCIYLAKINKLQIVNSYFLINTVVSTYKSSNEFYKLYNSLSGSAYQQGALPLITEAEINKNFIEDYDQQQALISQYKLEETAVMKDAFIKNNLSPLSKIEMTINYTQAKDFASRAEFYFIADAAGIIEVNYSPVFDLPGKGKINFTAEATEKTLGIIKDFTVTNNGTVDGSFKIDVPIAGTYKLTVSSMFKVTVKLSIQTNGNYFFRNGPLLGNNIENYNNSPLSLPGYFYVPEGIDRVYFSLMNAKPVGGEFATPALVNQAFLFKNAVGKPVDSKMNGNIDSALFYFDIPAGEGGKFWKASKMGQYKLCFANISNVLWYAEKKNCEDVAFVIDVLNNGGECITKLLATSAAHTFKWKVEDGTKVYEYSGKSVNLPAKISPAALVTLTADFNCVASKKLSDYPGYLSKKSGCATGAFNLPAKAGIVIYPNPGTGLFKCMLNNQPVTASSIDIYSSYGTKAASFSNSQQFNLADLPAAIYMYKIMIDETVYTGKLVKM